MKLIKLFGCLFIVSFLSQSCDPEITPCPQPRFTVEVGNSPNHIIATADFEGIEDVVHSWYIDDNLVETIEPGNNRSNKFDADLSKAGTYRICLKVESEECDEALEFCLEVKIEKDGPTDEDCFQPEFQIKETDRHDVFSFHADFDGMDTLVYSWYVDDLLVETEELNDNRDNKLLWDFDPGQYTICMVVQSDVCPDNLKFCRELTVKAADCPELSFVANEDPVNVYTFKADFEGKEALQYKWYINDDLVDQENTPGSETDHQLYWQFGPGEHTICIVGISDQCEKLEFCKQIVAENPEGCPDLFFRKEKISDRNYKFFAEFEGINDLQWYGWFIDGEWVEDESTAKQGDNILDYVFTEGTHEICIMTETPDCPRGTEYCKTIDVVFEQSCKTLSFTAKKEADAPAYTFTADFEGRDDVTYIWSVSVNGDPVGKEVREAGSNDDHAFYWQFQPGEEYLVCLKQDGVECSNYQVCKEFIITP
ncbi:hypothetical protein FNH22_04850 [Fulvivirga sp. M361]|uniref:hypothetical protein n=1 Tax=Fulvivirga sp. M361 TaxID=2594266 RepID=UPI001179B4D2|nr:hypothetical protein [Fulvivirga sp. M361]TRX61387.1 hypothetical protein FNH22_04850 [Fulvivirga sp. M361]